MVLVVLVVVLSDHLWRACLPTAKMCITWLADSVHAIRSGLFPHTSRSLTLALLLTLHIHPPALHVPPFHSLSSSPSLPLLSVALAFAFASRLSL